jgi:hypothetical protein
VEPAHPIPTEPPLARIEQPAHTGGSPHDPPGTGHLALACSPP